VRDKNAMTVKMGPSGVLGYEPMPRDTPPHFELALISLKSWSDINRSEF
jgi:hypothetical protein